MKGNKIFFYCIAFVLIVLTQGLVLDQIELGWGIHIMIYPMFILLLPFEMRPINLMFFAFFLGLVVDAFTNSFGLHASSAVVLAYFRPEIYKILEPRDGYDNMRIGTLTDMGRNWFLRAYGLALITHHLCFFVLEIFKISDIFFILQKTILSVIISFFMIAFMQLIFLKRAQKS